ncbi:Gldg family protein [Paenibacillus crassostreae]|uniref:Endonuclease n=1 Tax=Paenibacillus crassostreae TaxID=1763538 RepID=A0A167FFF2_9BACL|nr:endonuclease [Paenibacillus crassostreae]AOZ94462.1 endonuclease [Paenibacillus crassostreae]OAB76500.1 endonuclease [Paenibacillus crassostreae]
MKQFTKFKTRVMKSTIALSLAFSLQVAIGSELPTVMAEGPTDPAPFIMAKVVNENAGKKILFDNTHGQTAGAADWVIDGAFSDFGNALANEGYDVQELRKTTAISYDDLKDYDVFVIAEANVPFKQSEQAAMEQYVNNGNSIFFIGDHYNADRNKNRWDGSESMNGYRRGAWADPTQGMSTEERNSDAMQDVVSSDWLGTNFGVRFRYNALGNITANDIVAADQSFGITEGVSAVAMHAGSTLAITDPSKAKGIVYLPETDEAWGNAVDQGVYNGGGINEGPYVAVSKVGAGKAAFIGDSSPVEDATPKYKREETGTTKTTYDGFKEQDDGVLLVNIMNWLAEDESYTSLDQVANLQLDPVTALLPIEVPQTSTEPQFEPWSAPAAGYKWWDRSTFKAGSYGGPTASASASYSFVHQAQLPNAEHFQIRVVADNLPANSTVSGFSTGIYLAGGTQVAKVQNADGTWPTGYGYSTTFSMTSNSNGRAYKDLIVQLKPATTGSANLRLRQNGSNLITSAVQIADVPSETLPPEGNPIPDAITVAEARSLSEGSLVTLGGVITTEPGAFGGQAFYLQDATGGIYVYQSLSGFHQGDTIKITAPLTLYNTELELTNPVTLEKTGTSSLPDPSQASTVNDANQGQLIKLQNVTIHNIITASPSGSFEFDAVNGSISTHVRVDTRTGLSLTDFPYEEGEIVDIKGISAIFKGVYQLKPRGISDFSLSLEETAPILATDVPGKPILSDNNGHDTGLLDGDYTITMNLWWGNNGSVYKLYENGILIDTQKLNDSSPSAQSVKTDISGKSNGIYTYTAELSNVHGTATSDQLNVAVTDSSPGKSVLSHDNWDGDGTYNLTMNLWWGTNGSEYRLYENGTLIDTRILSEVTPHAQNVVSELTDRTVGEYEYYAELINAAGTTTSETTIVHVDK